MSIKHKLAINNIEIEEGDIVKVKYSKFYVKNEASRTYLPFEYDNCIGRVCEIKNDKIIIDCSKYYISNIVEISLEKDGLFIMNIEKIRGVITNEEYKVAYTQEYKENKLRKFTSSTYDFDSATKIKEGYEDDSSKCDISLVKVTTIEEDYID